MWQPIYFSRPQWAKSHRFAVLIRSVKLTLRDCWFHLQPRGKCLLPGIVVESLFERRKKKRKKERRRRRRMIYLRTERSPARSYVIKACHEEPLGKILSSLDSWFTYRKRWLLPTMTEKLLIWTLSHKI